AQTGRSQTLARSKRASFDFLEDLEEPAMTSFVTRASDLFRHSSFVIRHFAQRSFVIFLTLQFFIASTALLAEPPPSAKEILDSVRLLESRQQIDLDGQLRENGVTIPFRLAQNGSLIRYT